MGSACSAAGIGRAGTAKGGALVRPPIALSIVPSAINASAAGIRQIATRDFSLSASADVGP